MNTVQNNFNPNDKKYRCCGCHVKTCTVVFSALEVFLICFLLITVLPDSNSKICDVQETNNSLSSDVQQFQRAVNGIHTFVCQLNILWVLWSVTQIVAVSIMLYGLKYIKWTLFIPHIILRIICLVEFVAAWLMSLIGAIFYIQHKETQNDAIFQIFLVVFIALFILFWIYAMVCQLRCCEFIKRSADTGFSLSRTRSLGPGPPSMKGSRVAAPSVPPLPAPLAMRQLPPLKRAPNRKTTPTPVYADLLKADPLARNNS